MNLIFKDPKTPRRMHGGPLGPYMDRLPHQGIPCRPAEVNMAIPAVDVKDRPTKEKAGVPPSVEFVPQSDRCRRSEAPRKDRPSSNGVPCDAALASLS